MYELSRDFKGVWIPKSIWLDDRLNALDKIILVEIDSLDASDEGCYASNQYLAEFCQCSETKISTAINKLVDLKYLEIVKFDGRKRFIKSRIKIFESLPLKNLKSEFKNFKDINIINNKDNNNNKYKAPTLEEIKQYCEERNNNVDYQKFYDYYSISKWKDKDGKQVKNWKQKIITWEGRNKKSENVPEWYKKEYKKQELDNDELQEMEELMKDFK